MKEHEISTPLELETAIAGNEMRRREKLWKAAEGRAYRWPDDLAAIVGILMFLGGNYLLAFAGEIDGASQALMGVFLGGAAMWRLQQIQIDGLRELVKEIDRGAP